MDNATHHSWRLTVAQLALSKPVIMIGIGLPGSGKTTLLKPLAAELSAEYINRDEIRTELTGDPTNHTMEPAVNSFVDRRIIDSLRNQKSILVDATNVKRKDRRHLIEIAQKHLATKIIGLYVNTDLATSIQRNNLRQRNVPEEVIERMYNKLTVTPPSTDEGFDILLLTAYAD
jgi:predicted kinase